MVRQFKTADDTANANANAMLNWNEDTKESNRYNNGYR